MVAATQQIASAYQVHFGHYGDVTRHAHERGVCRQWIYRESQQLLEALETAPQHLKNLQQQIEQAQQTIAQLQGQRTRAVVLDDDKQAQFAAVGQAEGVSLTTIRSLLTVLRPDGELLSVPTLGRRTQEAGANCRALLEVLDAWTRPQVRQAAADEIYVSDPVLMVVEQESLCWTTGRLSAEVSGEAWAKEFRQLPQLEQLTRDGGKGLQKGVALVNEERSCQERPGLVDQGDHYHALRGGGVGWRHAQRRVLQAFAAVDEAEQQRAEESRQGRSLTGPSRRVRAAWKRAEAAYEEWLSLDKTWQQTKEALTLFTPTGELNTRERAAEVLAETLPQLPAGSFAKTKRQLQKPELLNYLDQVQQKLQALPYAEELKQAAVRQEGLKRRPELLQGDSSKAAAMRGVLLLSAVVLSQAGAAGQQAVAGVQAILRQAHRASSLVECLNSVLRMQQSRHRRMTQGLLDLKRLYWNCHSFRAGRRKGKSPYALLGVELPPGLRWWELLKLTPEELRIQLSTSKTPP
jgi:hypothetical protein